MQHEERLRDVKDRMKSKGVPTKTSRGVNKEWGSNNWRGNEFKFLKINQWHTSSNFSRVWHMLKNKKSNLHLDKS